MKTSSVRARLQHVLVHYQRRTRENLITEALRERVRHLPIDEVETLIDATRPEALGLTPYQFFEARRAVLSYCEVD